MKPASPLLFLSIFLMAYCCCTPPPEITIHQERAKVLSEGTWSFSQKIVNATGDPLSFDDMHMTFGVDPDFTPSTFSAVNCPLFETSSSSTWELYGLENFIVYANGEQYSFQISELTDNHMLLTFTYVDPDYDPENDPDFECPDGMVGCLNFDHTIEMIR